MTVFIFCALLAWVDLAYPRTDPRERGLKGWYAMRSFTHPFQVVIYGAIVWIAPPCGAYFLWGLAA